MRNVPKSNVAVVLGIFIALMSWLSYTLQNQKYQKVVKYLKDCTINNLGPNNGGTRETMELHRRALGLYEAHIDECTYGIRTGTSVVVCTAVLVPGFLLVFFTK
jgi:hypothetical protein